MITVQVDCSKGQYESDVYTDNYNCYLARALKKKTHKKVFVLGSFGVTSVDINGKRYHTVDDFSCTTIKRAFRKKEILTVKLKRV